MAELKNRKSKHQKAEPKIKKILSDSYIATSLNSQDEKMIKSASWKEKPETKPEQESTKWFNFVKKASRKRVFFLLGSFLGAIMSFGYVFYYNPSIPMFNRFADYVTLKFEDTEILNIFQTQRLDVFKNLTSMLFPEKGIATEDLMPGLQLMQNYTMKPLHPVIMIPGIITSGLESWSMDGCSQKYFRKRLWGTLTMFKAAFIDKDCWIKNIKLNDDGSDPEGAKLRAAQGLDAGDYFVTGYWVWGKLIENLAAIGYDSNNMHFAAYDWRLAYEDLEKRDRYFSKLKKAIEDSLEYGGNKAVILTHSMGSLVFYYFLKWAENSKGGDGGKNWTEKYIDSVVNIGGSFLGATKSISSFVSGEQKELVQPMTAFVLNRFLTRKERVDIMKSWLGMSSLIPKGGSKIWGSAKPYTESQVDDKSFGSLREHSKGAIIRLSNGTHINEYDMQQSIEFIFGILGETFKSKIKSLYSYGIVEKAEEMLHNDQRTWSNPLESQLPFAPSLKIYCIYGYGNPTEHAYYYKRNENYERSENSAHEEVMYRIDSEKEAAEININGGVLNDEGDGSVQLLSLGFMGVKGWKTTLYNPAKIKVITREYKHKPVPLYEDMRGGIETSDHVDILGNHYVTKDILKIVTGVALDTLGDKIDSKIVEVSNEINL